MFRAIVLAVAVAVGFGIGWSWRDSRCDEAAAKAALANEQSAHAATRQQLETMQQTEAVAAAARAALQKLHVDLGTIAAPFKRQLPPTTKGQAHACSLDAADLQLRGQLRARAAGGR